MIMKTLSVLFTALFVSNVCIADIFNVTLYKNTTANNDHVKNIPVGRSMSVIPSVMYDDDTKIVSVTSSRLIENAHIIITDCNGAVIIDEVSSLTNAGVRLQLPDTDEGGMYKIEIEYGDTYLYGFIN